MGSRCFVPHAGITYSPSFVLELIIHVDTFTFQIKVSNSALISAFMTELEPDSPVSQVSYFSKLYESSQYVGLYI